MVLPDEERKREKQLLEELKDYVISEQKSATERENGTFTQKISERISQTFRLNRRFEKCKLAIFHFNEVKKYLTEKYQIEGKSITMQMIDAESLRTLEKGTKPYIDFKTKTKEYGKKQVKQ